MLIHAMDKADVLYLLVLPAQAGNPPILEAEEWHHNDRAIGKDNTEKGTLA